MSLVNTFTKCECEPDLILSLFSRRGYKIGPVSVSVCVCPSASALTTELSIDIKFNYQHEGTTKNTDKEGMLREGASMLRHFHFLKNVFKSHN